MYYGTLLWRRNFLVYIYLFTSSHHSGLLRNFIFCMLRSGGLINGSTGTF